MERLFANDRWQSAAESFIQSIYAKSGSTESLVSYTRIMHEFFGGDPERSAENYSRQDVEAYLARPSRSSRNYGKVIGTSARNQRIAVLASFYRYASTYTVTVDGKPTALLQRLPPTTGMTYGKPPKSYRALTISEIEKLFAVLSGDDVRSLRDRAIYLWLLLTSKRRTEVTSLSWGSIITDGDHMAFRYYPKGSSRQEHVQELPPEVYNALIAYLKAAGRLESMKPEDPLFVSMEPRHGGNFRNVGKRLSGHAINWRLKELCREANITDVERISVHSLRHSSARLRAAAGQPITSISRILGHASLATTSHYLEDLQGISDPGIPLLTQAMPFLAGK